MCWVSVFCWIEFTDWHRYTYQLRNKISQKFPLHAESTHNAYDCEDLSKWMDALIPKPWRFYSELHNDAHGNKNTFTNHALNPTRNILLGLYMTHRAHRIICPLLNMPNFTKQVLVLSMLNYFSQFIRFYLPLTTWLTLTNKLMFCLKLPLLLYS